MASNYPGREKGHTPSIPNYIPSTLTDLIYDKISDNNSQRTLLEKTVLPSKLKVPAAISIGTDVRISTG